MQEVTPSGTAPPLVAAIIGLAGLAEDSPAVDEHLDRIVRLTATLVDEVVYASVTRMQEGRPTTVALSDEVARAVDEAQYYAGGPCLRALAVSRPLSVDLARTVEWPEFRQKAAALGLRASLSVPLVVGRGSAAAALNLLGRDQDAMDALSRRVWSASIGAATAEEDAPPAQPSHVPAAGARQLVAGLTHAREVTGMVRTAVHRVAVEHGVDEDEAYQLLRRRAAEQGSSLLRTAIELAVRAPS